MQLLFCNGTIHTLCGLPQEALLVQNGTIAALGPRNEVEARQIGPVQIVDLQGGALLPGFLDAHSHLSGYASSLLQVPLGDARSFADIEQAIRAFLQEHAVKPGCWVQGGGYDHTALKEGEHPDKTLLDAAAPQNPVVIQHASGHFGVFNTCALKALGLTGLAPHGFLREKEYIEAVQRVPMPDFSALCAAFAEAQRRYASFGITTVQEGMMTSAMAPLYAALCEQERLFLDVVGYADLRGGEEVLKLFGGKRTYEKHFRLGGYKIFLDGSPQGKTAWMRTPYKGEGSWCGTPELTQEEVTDFCLRAAADNRQLLAHCNGDAAAARLLAAWGRVQKEIPHVRDLRPVMIHAQLLGVDQLTAVKQLGVLPSFFVAHVYHWGETHVKNFGLARAEQISPAASALEAGIRFTFHQDAPVIAPDMMETLWCACTRHTRTGRVLGEKERITPYAALEAVTCSAAYQYGEELTKGRLAPGMRADLVWLERDPLSTPIEELRNIRVKGTWKDGHEVFKAH